MYRAIIQIAIIALFQSVPVFAQDWKENFKLGNDASIRKQADSAIMYFQKALEQLPDDSLNSATQIQLHFNIVKLYISKRQTDLATSQFEQLRKVVAVSKSNYTPDSDYAIICNSLGGYNISIGNFELALSLFKDSREIRKKIFSDTSLQYAQSCNNTGAVYREMGEYELAEPFVLKALEIRRKIPPEGKDSVYAISCVNMANLYRDMGQFEKAEHYYLEAKLIRSLFKPENGSDSYANACNILADLYYYMQQFEKAEALYLEAKKIREKSGIENNYYYGQSCNNLASLYRDMGRLDDAEKEAIMANKIYVKVLPEGHKSRTININNLGELYLARKEYVKSKDYFMQSRLIWSKSFEQNHPFMISNSDNLIKIYAATNEIEEAAKLIAETSKQKYKQLQQVFQFTSENEKHNYLENIQGSNDGYYSFYLSKYNPANAGDAYNIALFNRNLILSSLQNIRKVIYETKDLELMSIYDEWEKIRQQLAKLITRGVDINLANQRNLENHSDSLEKELAKKSNVFQIANTTIDWKMIQSKLLSNEAAIEFVEFQFNSDNRWTDSVYYMALLIRKDLLQPVLIPLFEKKQLEKILSEKKPSLGELFRSYYKSDDLYKLIWRPIEKYLNSINTIYYAPAGKLNQISFAALQVSNEKHLADMYKLQQLLTTASVCEKDNSKFEKDDIVILYGDIDYDVDSTKLRSVTNKYYKDSTLSRSVNSFFIDGEGHVPWVPLPASEQEINSIIKSATLKTGSIKYIKGIEANEESVKSLNWNESSIFLHFSTHGYFFPDPGKKYDAKKNSFGGAYVYSENPLFRSGLIMAGGNSAWLGKPVKDIEDGVLTAYEISNLYLPNNKLVVLSACQTGLGDIAGSEGVYGLQRSFKLAGSKYLIMSLCIVNDEKTAEFMIIFYEELFKGLTIVESFRKAQDIMKNKYRNDPYYWAPWILVN